jgi:hypothetical protein
VSTIKIKDGYISFTNSDGRQDSEWFGGFDLVNNKPKQKRFTKAGLIKRAKQLRSQGCKIGIIEVCTYQVEQDEHAELIDPINRQYIEI